MNVYIYFFTTYMYGVTYTYVEGMREETRESVRARV